MKGQHWRKPKLFWDKKWFEDQYYNLGKNYSDIAKEFNITSPAIRFWVLGKKTSNKIKNNFRNKKQKILGIKRKTKCNVW